MLSEVPEGWGARTVGDFVSIKTGKLDANAAVKGGEYKFFTCAVEDSEIDNYAFDGDYVIVAGNGDFNVKHYVGKFNAYQRTYAVTSTSPESLDNTFLYFWQMHSLQRLRDLSVGGVIKYLKLGMIRDAEIALPPLNEQHRIAEILSSVDASIQATQAVIEQAERVKRGLMEELLTGGLGSAAIERGEVPDGWELCQLADKSKFTNGKAHEKDIDENGDFIVVNSKFISSEGSVAKRTNSAMCLAAKNDILMVMSDVPKGKAIAKCFYVDKGDFYTVNQRICRLTAQEIEPLFLFYVLNRNRYFLAFDDGVKQTNLRKNEVLECPVGVPPVDYQRKVIEILEAFTAKIDLDYKQLNRLKIIKRGLMDDLLTGKVRTV